MLQSLDFRASLTNKKLMNISEGAVPKCSTVWLVWKIPEDL